MFTNRIRYFCCITIFIQQLVHYSYCQDQILCTNTYCNDITCSSTISDECRTNGKFLQSPETCNCCDYCLEYIGEGGACSSGSQSGVTASKYCGPGLYCDQNTQTCIKFTNMEDDTNMPVCSKKQKEYDERRKNGDLGIMEVRPICDRNGLFEPYHCIPGQICYCVDKFGERIHGEIDFTSTPEYSLKCPCSRGIREGEKILEITVNPDQHFRCTSSGKYDVIQCLDEKNCFCIDADDGAPTYPNKGPISIENISEDTLPCFDKDQHTTGAFYKNCEEKYMEILKEIEEFKKDEFEIFFSYVFPSCEFDGTYGLIQQNETSKYCSYPDGTVINDNEVQYIIDISDSMASEMNCKCAKAVSIMSSLEKPRCDKSGNYEKIQCRRGKCYCVDENGNQTKKEVDEADQNTLICEENAK